MKNAIITGAGRNGGIGAEVCRRFAQQGINIYFTSFDFYDCNIAGISKDDYNKTLDECRSYGVKAYFGIYDLTDSKNIKKIFQDATEKIGNINILVNCACYHVFDDLEKLSDELIDVNLNVNTKAILLMCREFYVRHTGEYGRIINLSSTQNLDVLTSEIAYAITKSTIPVITSTLAPILAVKGITINSVNPGATDIGDLNDRNIYLYKEKNLFGRIGTPEDAANLICFLTSEKGKWITGQTFNSEGALLRGIT